MPLSASRAFAQSVLPITGEPAKKEQVGPREPAKVSGKGQVGEFVIKGEGGLTLDSDKPPLNAGPNDQEPLAPTLEPERHLFLANPPDFSRMEAATPVTIRSEYVIRPRHFNFHPDEVAYEFNLAKELDRVYQEQNIKAAEKLGRWEFNVADASGKSYAQFSGKGLPPGNLRIPTMNPGGEEIRPGNPYAGVLTYRDTFGEVHTAVTKPFVLYGLVESSSKGHILHLALSYIFDNKNALSLTQTGRALIEETSDWIKAHNMALAPLYITIFSKNPEQAQNQANDLALQMAGLLLRKMDNIHPKGVLREGTLEERVEISVFLPKEKKK